MINSKTNENCPCGSGLSMKACCLPFILGQEKPKAALQLMRSRYTAYTLEQYGYVYDTWHPDYRPSMKQLTSDKNPPNWVQLKIIESQMGQQNDNYGEVEFEAHFEQDGERHTMKERSEFVKTNGQWLYTIGVNRHNVRR